MQSIPMLSPVPSTWLGGLGMNGGVEWCVPSRHGVSTRRQCPADVLKIQTAAAAPVNVRQFVLAGFSPSPGGDASSNLLPSGYTQRSWPVTTPPSPSPANADRVTGLTRASVGLILALVRCGRQWCQGIAWLTPPIPECRQGGMMSCIQLLRPFTLPPAETYRHRHGGKPGNIIGKWPGRRQWRLMGSRFLVNARQTPELGFHELSWRRFLTSRTNRLSHVL